MDLFREHLLGLQEYANNPSALMFELLGTQLSAGLQSLAGLDPRALPETFTEDYFDTVRDVTPTLMGTPVDIKMYRRIASNLLNEIPKENRSAIESTTGMPFNEILKSVRKGGVPFKTEQSVEAVRTGLEAGKMVPGDLGIAMRLGTKSATYSDVMTEYSRALIMPSAIFGATSYEHGQEFTDATQAALEGGFRALATYNRFYRIDPNAPGYKGEVRRFDTFVTDQMRNSVVANQRAVKRTFNLYGGVDSDMIEEGVQKMVGHLEGYALRNLAGGVLVMSEMNDHLAADPNIPWMEKSVTRESFPNMMREYFTQTPTELRAMGLLDRGDYDVSPVPQNSDMFQELKRIAMRRGSVPATGSKGQILHLNPRMIDMVSRLTGGNPDPKKAPAHLKPIVESLVNAYSSFSAPSYVPDDDFQSFEQLDDEERMDFLYPDTHPEDRKYDLNELEKIHDDVFFDALNQGRHKSTKYTHNSSSVSERLKDARIAAQERERTIRNLGVDPKYINENEMYENPTTFNMDRNVGTIYEKAQTDPDPQLSSHAQNMALKGKHVSDQSPHWQPTFRALRGAGAIVPSISKYVRHSESDVQVPIKVTPAPNQPEANPTSDSTGKQQPVVTSGGQRLLPAGRIRGIPNPNTAVRPDVIPLGGDTGPLLLPARAGVVTSVAGGAMPRTVAPFRPEVERPEIIPLPGRQLKPAITTSASLMRGAQRYAEGDRRNPAVQYMGVPKAGSQESVALIEDNLVIYGGPGTGKTETLAKVAKADAGRGVDPGDMLFLTGTTTARSNWAERIQRPEYVNEIGDFGHIESFHQLAIRSLANISGRYGVPSSFTTRKVLGPGEVFERVGAALQDVGHIDFAFDQYGNRSVEYVEEALKYTSAVNDFAGNLHTTADLSDAKFMRRFSEERNIDPKIFSDMYGKYMSGKRQHGEMSFADVISEFVRVGESSPKALKALLGEDMYSAIYMDEINQLSTGTYKMSELLAKANPNAKFRIGSDPMQAGAYDWIGGSPDKGLNFGEQIGAKFVSLHNNYRLRQGSIDVVSNLFDLKQNQRPVSINDRGGQVGDAFRLNVGYGQQDTNLALAADVAKAIKEGSNPKDVFVQARTNKDVYALDQALRSQGVRTFRKLDELDFAWEIATGVYTVDQVQEFIQAQKQPSGTVRLGTGHHFGGDENRQIFTKVSARDLPENTPQQRWASRSLAAVMYSRASVGADGEGGVNYVYADATRGGLPEHLQQYDLPVRESALHQQNMGTRRSPVMVDLAVGGSREMLETAFTGGAVSNGISPQAAADARTIVSGTLDGMLNQAAEGGDFCQDAREIQAKLRNAAMKFYDKLTENIVQQHGDSQEQRQYFGEVRSAMDQLIDAGGNFLGTGGAGGSAGVHPSGGMTGANSPGYSRNFNNQSNAFWKSPLYRIGRAGYFAQMAVQNTIQGFQAEFTQAKRFGSYLSYYSPFAAMEGDLMESPQAYAINQAQVARAKSQGAYEQWGSFTNRAGESAEANEGWYRGMSVLRPSMKMVGAGATGTMAASMMGLSGLAAGVPLIGTVLAAGVAMTTAGAMEVYNDYFKPADHTPMTMGKLFVDMPDRNKAIQESQEEAVAIYAQRNNKTVEEVKDLINAEGKRSLGEWYGLYAGGPGMVIAEDMAVQSLQEEINEIAWHEVVSAENESLYNRFYKDYGLAERAQDVAEEMTKDTGEDVTSATGAIMTMYRSFATPNSAFDYATTLSKQAGELGMGSLSLLSSKSKEAQQLGLQIGTVGYQEYITGETVDMSQVDSSAVFSAVDKYYKDRIEQSAAQLQGYFVTPGLANYVVKHTGAITQPQLSGIISAISDVQSYGYSEQESLMAAYYANQVTPYQAQQISNIAGNLMQTVGYDPMKTWSAMSDANWSPSEYIMAGNIMGGNIQSLSYASWTGAFDGAFSGWENRFYDTAGAPIYMYSGRDYMRWAQANGIMQTPPGLQSDWFQSLSPAIQDQAYANMPAAMEFQHFFGHSDMAPEYYEAWAEGGLHGAQNYVQQQLAELSLASAGIQMQQLNANRAYYWGEGGSWDNPTSDSMWGMQDTLRSMQYNSQMAKFAYTEETAAASWQYQLATNQMTEQRMDLSQDYQRYNQGYSRTMAQLQRQWTQEDWAYQDTMSSLSFEWGLEDINEAIRGATGRERRTLIEKRERMTTKRNLEQEQLDTTRDRQEELWARQDERFEKQAEYQNELMDLERQGFDLSVEHQEEMHGLEMENFERLKKEYEEQFRLQEEMNQRQREHQAEMMDFQEKSIGIQAAAAALQRQLAEDSETATLPWQILLGKLENANKNDPANGTIAKFAEMVDSLAKNSDAVAEANKFVDGLTTSYLKDNAMAITGLIKAINSINPWVLDYLTNFGVFP